MKEINYCSTTYGTLFWKDDWFHYIHENDATWRSEYFDPIMKFLEIRFIEHDKIPEIFKSLINQLEA